MKNLVFTLLVIVVCISCTFKRTRIENAAIVDGILIDTTTVEWIKDSTGLDFILDTTLQRLYSEIPEDSFISDVVNQEVCSGYKAFSIAEPHLTAMCGEENISFQKPFRINLVDDIWVIYGTLPKTKEGRSLGGVAYLEIRKKDGLVLKAIHGE